MSFLQPLMLFAVPLIALPVVIHLINQRRYQNLRWGAMQFLLSAKRMSSGYARIRQWLILACRTLAIAGMVFAASRPLASGVLGLVGGTRADTTIILLDRSPSMAQTGADGLTSKRESSTAQLVETLKTLRASHWVLIESNRETPLELESIDELLRLPESGVSSATADIPQMLGVAAKYIQTNNTGRTDIWICSDGRANDWRPDSADWRQLRDKFLAFPQGVRFQLFAYSTPADENVAIQVTDVQQFVHRDSDSDTSTTELSLSLRVSREQATQAPVEIPVQIEIGGARSQARIALSGTEAELRGHRIPIALTQQRGWGRVSIPADANLADNEYYFVFDKPQPRRAVVVLEDEAAEQFSALQVAPEVAPNDAVVCQTVSVRPDQIDAVAWENTALVLWQAPLPSGTSASLLQHFVGRGGQIMFFAPSAGGGSDSFMGVRWQPWQNPSAPKTVTHWTMDQDLLANPQSGVSLPVGDLQTIRYRQPSCADQHGELTALATIDGGIPLLSRLPTDSGGVYFLSTTTRATDSNLADNGAVLYVSVQRALASGAASLGTTRSAIAGQSDAIDQLGTEQWKQQAGSSVPLSTDYAFTAGVYNDDERLLSINRAADTEDHAKTLAAETFNGLFQGLDFSIVQNKIGTPSSLVQEIWRAFLVLMMVALLIEGILCIPRRWTSQENKNSIFRERAERETVVNDMKGKNNGETTDMMGAA